MELYDDERLDDLIAENLKIIQSKAVFSYSLDAVLLADFASVPKQKGKIVDLCSGNGVIPLYLTGKSKAQIYGVELQERLADMAKRSVSYNHLEEQIDILQADLKEAPKLFGKDSVDTVTCNPPYFPLSKDSVKNPNEHLAIARHEIHTNLDEVVRVSSELLKMKGKFAMVHRPERLTEILLVLEKYRIAPKRMRLVYPKVGKEANILLIEGIKDGSPGLKILSPLFVYDEEDHYLPEVSGLVHGK